MNNSTTKQTPGFSLALTMLLSVVILGVLFGVYRVITALYINAQESYYLKLAEEAGGGRERIWKFKGAWIFSCTSRSIPSEEYSISSIYVRGS